MSNLCKLYNSQKNLNTFRHKKSPNTVCNLFAALQSLKDLSSLTMTNWKCSFCGLLSLERGLAGKNVVCHKLSMLLCQNTNDSF